MHHIEAHEECNRTNDGDEQQVGSPRLELLNLLRRDLLLEAQVPARRQCQDENSEENQAQTCDLRGKQPGPRAHIPTTGRNRPAEQVEALDHEPYGQDRQRGTDPGEVGSLVGGMVAEVLDHRVLRPIRRQWDREARTALARQRFYHPTAPPQRRSAARVQLKVIDA